MFSKHRLEALSDAVFAIAMTLLILDIKVPAIKFAGDAAQGQLAAGLAQESHEWISFLVTFCISSIFWTLQHRVFEVVEDVSTWTVALTFLFLGLVSVLPFSTSLWGHYLGVPLASAIYFANQFAIAAVLGAKLELARVRHHARLGAEFQVLRVRLLWMSATMLSGVVGVLLLPLNRAFVLPLGIALVGKFLRNRGWLAAAVDARVR